MSGVKNNVGRGINVALVNGEWHFKWVYCFHFQIASEVWSEILKDGEGQVGGEKEVFSLFILKESQVLALVPFFFLEKQHIFVCKNV